MSLSTTDSPILPPSKSSADPASTEVIEQLETVLALDPTEPPAAKYSRETLLAFGALGVALVSVALSAVFVKFSEEEINPYATAFNRFWMTTVILVTVAGFKAVRQRFQSAGLVADAEPVVATIYTKQVIGQLVLAGGFWAVGDGDDADEHCNFDFAIELDTDFHKFGRLDHLA
jgi:hypothetical protein